MNTPTDMSPAGDQNPAARFARPADVVVDQHLTIEAKHSLLKEWEEDIRSRLVASEEGMTGTTPKVGLADVLAAIAALPMETEARPETPSKA